MAALAAAGLIDLETLAQDGVRVRASAGAASFRREATLEQHLATAQAVVEELKREVDDAARTPAISASRRPRSGRRASAASGSRRRRTALGEIKRSARSAKRSAASGKKRKEPRASTTDPQARVMKMADGGFRPAYNVQVVSAAGEQIVVDVGPLATPAPIAA